MIICRICHTSFQQLNATHLRKHTITIGEYKERFPRAPIMKPVEWSDERREGARQRRLGTTWDQSVKDKIGLGNKGKIMSPESIEQGKASRKIAEAVNGGGFATGPRSDEFKAKMSEIALVRPPELVQAKVEQMWAARRGQVEGIELREKRRNARVKFMAENPDKCGIKFFDTVPELEFEKELKKLGIEYTKQYHSTNPHYLYDFKIGDSILVEIDGPYHYEAKFHATPELFENMKRRDANKTQNALDRGFVIGRIQVGQHLPTDWDDILQAQGINLAKKNPEFPPGLKVLTNC